MLTDFWESQALMKSLYAMLAVPICEKYDLTKMELDILLFIANNPTMNTATAMVENRQLTKSHVSTSIKDLQRRGLVQKYYFNGNVKTEHLSLTGAANPIVEDGRHMQKRYFDILTQDVSRDAVRDFLDTSKAIVDNVRTYMEENL